MVKIHTIQGRLTKYGQANDHRQCFTPQSFELWLLDRPTVPLLFEHKPGIVAGEATGFESRKDGLYVTEAVLFDSPEGRDVKRLIDVDIVISLSMLYLYSASQNPEPVFGGPREIKSVMTVQEISAVISPADAGAFIEGKQTRENNIEAFSKRMDNYFKVKWMLETETIKAMVEAKWKEVYSEFWERSVNGQSMTI